MYKAFLSFCLLCWGNTDDDVPATWQHRATKIKCCWCLKNMLDSSTTTIACKAAVVVRPLLEREAGAKASLSRVEGKSSHLAFDESALTRREYGPFDAVPISTQDLFDTSVKSALLDDLLRGFNVTVLAYGQTGSGKTFTMGSGDDSSTPGLIQLTVLDLFGRLPAGARALVTFVQVYCEELHDLLAEDGRELLSCSLNEKKTGFVAKGAKAVACDSPEAVFAALKSGVHNRRTGATRMNAHSSRSHALFTLQLELPSEDGCGASLCPKIHFVDLAGSERSKRAETEGQRLREGNNINKSLVFLGQVIDARAKKQPVTVRNSVLTMLLDDSLGGNSQTLMVACVSPSAAEREETKGTLDYASRVRQITNKLSRVESAAAGAARVVVREVVREVVRTEEAERRAEAEAALELERAERAAEREQHEATIAALEARLVGMQDELDATACRELVVRGTLLAAEQRLRLSEKAVSVAEARLAKCEKALSTAQKDKGEAKAALTEALSQLREVRSALEQAREECANCREQLSEREEVSSSDERHPSRNGTCATAPTLLARPHCLRPHCLRPYCLRLLLVLAVHFPTFNPLRMRSSWMPPPTTTRWNPSTFPRQRRQQAHRHRQAHRHHQPSHRWRRLRSRTGRRTRARLLRAGPSAH